jgi:hypothetical protein
VIYAGDSAADELAISRLKGVAHTFRVINEDSTVITKTAADYRLEGWWIRYMCGSCLCLNPQFLQIPEAF